MAIPLDLQLRTLRRRLMASTIYKIDDETIQSDETLNMDSQLRFNAASNANYEFEFSIWYDTVTAADFRFGLNGPASPTRVYAHADILVPDDVSTTPASSNTTHAALRAYETSGIIITSATQTTAGHVYMNGILHNGANAGAFGFTWAQGTSTAGNTTVLACSWLRYSVVS